MSPRTHFDRRGNETKKGGRPKLPPGEKRDCPVKEPVPQDTMKCLRALAGMANNLNQLAHLGHIHGPHYIADENRRLMAEISGLIVKLNELL